MQPREAQEGRRLIHRRQVECQGWLRPDGLWDIEGQLTDTKSHPVVLAEGRALAAGQTYHGMRVRMTLDDDFYIHEVEVQMLHVPTRECPGAAAAYQQLVGLRIGAGFSKQVKALFAGTAGCIHLTELLQPIATTAFQTIPMGRALVAPRNEQDKQAYSQASLGLRDSCHALRSEGPLVLQLLKWSEQQD